MSNELWKLETGWLAGYTEDKSLIRRIRRYKDEWQVMAEYYEKDKPFALQFKIPIEQRRPAERMFGVTVSK